MRSLFAAFLVILNLSLAFGDTDCDFCPKNGKSSCESRNTLPIVVDGWHYNRAAQLYFKCSCVEGYLGDGWRCEPINECVYGLDGIPAADGEEEDYPCPPASVGGFCENRDPQDTAFPRYKCGCNADDGYQACLSGPNGAKGCVAQASASTSDCVDYSIAPPTPAPSMSPVPPTLQDPLDDGCNLCPETAFCTEVDANTADSYLSEEDGGIWIKCSCKVGYAGLANGFRCEPVNECESGIEGNASKLPCVPEADGGFCVDKRPDDGQYECGCSEGYVTDGSDKHGATSCKETLPSVSPTISPVPSSEPTKSSEPTTSPTREPTKAPSKAPMAASPTREPTIAPIAEIEFDESLPSARPSSSLTPSLIPSISHSQAPIVVAPVLPTISNYPSTSDSPSITSFPSNGPSLSLIPSRTDLPSSTPSLSFLPSITSFPSSQPSSA